MGVPPSVDEPKPMKRVRNAKAESTPSVVQSFEVHGNRGSGRRGTRGRTWLWGAEATAVLTHLTIRYGIWTMS